MKNKSTRHKDLNTFKFLPFSERIANLDIDVFHRVEHEYETQDGENECYFYQTIDKWSVLNLTEGYSRFIKEIRPNSYITLPQLLLSKAHIVEVLLKHLKEKDALYLQPLLELTVAVAKDLQKEFYEYYPQFLDILIDLLDTKDTEQLERTFTCLAYLFKILWRILVKDVSAVFSALLPLLSDSRPEYINNFAAESFAFVARKVRDKKSFLNLLLKAVKNQQDGVSGCSKLLFEVIRGVDGQFHSCAETFLPFLFESLSDEKVPRDILFEILEQVVFNILSKIYASKGELLWTCLYTELNKLMEKIGKSDNVTLANNFQLILRLIGQSVEYKNGKFLQKPNILIELLMKILRICNLSNSSLQTITQISILLLLSKHLKISQEQASILIRKLLAIPDKAVILYFIDNVKNYSSFEATILPGFLRYCVKNNLDNDCLEVLTKLILTKSPLCESGINLSNWKKYAIDFKEFNSQMHSILLDFINTDDSSLLGNFSNYFCSLVCIPHLGTEISEELNIALEKKLLFLSQQLKNIENLSKEDTKLVLFLLNATFECIVHTQKNIVKLKDIFNIIFEQLLLFASEPKFLTSLKTLSLGLTCLADNLITMETLNQLNEKLEINFNSPFHEVRLVTTQIYSLFDSLPEFKISYNTDPDITPEEWRLFTICYQVESIDPQVDTYRNQLQHLEKLNFDKPQMLMCNQTSFKTIPLRYLCSMFFINFQLLWEPVSKIISTHAFGMDSISFWSIFGSQLRNACDYLENGIDNQVDVVPTSYTFLGDLYQDCQRFHSKPDFGNYRFLLWKTLSLFPHVAEAKTRDVAELILNFVEKEYLKSNSGNAGGAFSIKQHSKEIVDENAQEEVAVTSEVKANARKFPSSKVIIKTLLQKLNVLSQTKSPKSMYREPELYKLYFQLLQDKDSSIQKAALDCIITYKHKFLTPYKDNLYNLVDDKNFRHEIVSFKVDKDSNVVQIEHREMLIPIVMQIVFSKMNVKTGLRTGGKAGGQNRRNVIFKFLAGCQEDEMLAFLKKTLKLYNHFFKDDPKTTIDAIVEQTDLDKFIHPKQIQSTINLLNVIFDQCGGLMGNQTLSYLLDVLFVIGALLRVSLEQIEHVHAGYMNSLRTLRTSTIRLIGQFFEHFDRFPWNNAQINAVFDVFVWPYLDKLNIEGIHSPTTLLKMFVQWGSNPRYFPLLVKHKINDTDQYILPHVVRLLVNEKSNVTVVNVIEEMLEKLLSLQADEEDLQMALPVDNLLPVAKDILDKVGKIDNLNYGSCILLPQVPCILERIKKKLCHHKSKNLNAKELFILSRLSELVWQADISDTLLQLLLPVVLKKSFNCPEEVTLKYLVTINNLMRNVTKPQIHLKQVFPLFGQITYASCRKVLCQILEIVAEKSGEKELQVAHDVIEELMAWDKKWVEQPDFERRHQAFKHIQTMLDNNEISVNLGVVIIYNCFFIIKSDKDLSLRENASHTLKQLAVKLVKTYQKQCDYILNETLFLLIRSAIKSVKDDVRNEAISLLGHLARETPESHFILRDLNSYTNKNDLEVDFFENLTHLQIHRHVRALVRFCQITKEMSQTAPNPRTLTQFILPLASHYLCNDKYVSKNSILDAAIDTIGTVCRILPWHQYEAMLRYYLDRLSGRLDYQKQLVRLTVAILDAFHFDLSKGSVVFGEGKNNTKNEHVPGSEPVNQVEKKAEISENDDGFVDAIKDDANKDEEAVVEEDDKDADEFLDEVVDDDEDEEEEDEEIVENVQIKICDKITVLCKSTATRVIRTIEYGLLPKLQKSLAQFSQLEGSHKANKKQIRSDREEEDLLKVPISLALVKLLQRLPVKILDANIPSVFIKLCTFLKSHLDSVRKIARETLQKIMLTLGAKYLSALLSEMVPLLNRGFQVHVLVFTVHGVLSCLKNVYQSGDIDKILLNVLNLCTADLFGMLSEEKEVAKIAVKVSEARHTKTFDTLQILAQFITETCLLDLILPIKQVLESTHSFKTVDKAQTGLRFIALGLVDNEFVSIESLLKFAYGTASASIPQLLPKSKKQVLSQREAEKLQRQKEDCLIIPRIAGNRAAYRQQNVKVSSATNAHILTEFGLRLCHVMLKRDKLKSIDGGGGGGGCYKAYIDPFVDVFRNCLKSKHVKLSTLTMQCLSWVFKYELPSLKNNIKPITKDIFGILHKYASAGLSKGDNFDLVVAAFKAVAVLVRDAKYHTIDTNQLKILLLYAEQDIHDHDRQATAFSLLKAIIARKLIVPEIHDIMAKVAELSITSELDYVRDQARAVFHQFLMDYPLGNKLEQHLGFYISQMSYELKFGRVSAIEMIHTLINTFPLNVLKQHSATLLITLGARLVNDEEPECRKMVADCISAMLKKIPKQDYEPLYEIVTAWLKDKNISHRRLAAQLCGIFVTVEKSSFDTRLPKLVPLILKQFGLDNSTPGRFVKLYKENKKHKNNNNNDVKDDEEHQRIKDHHLFQVLQLMLKLCAHCSSFLKDVELVENLSVHAQTLLSYPHEWVRLAAAQFLGYVLAAMDVKQLASQLLHADKENTCSAGYLCTIDAIKSLTLDLCDQLQPGAVKSEMAEQVIKNLIFIAKVLQHIPIQSKEDNDNNINLLWLTKRMRKIINTEVVEDASSTVLRTEIFKWTAGVLTALDMDKVRPVLHHLMAPLVREMITTEEKNAPLRQLAKEVANLLKRQLGMEEYTQMLSKLQQSLSVRRAERKRARTQLAVTDPEVFAKKKIRRHEKKKESKKRKISEMKGGKKVFKRRRVVGDLELDSSEVL